MKRGKGEWEGIGVIREQRKMILDTETKPFLIKCLINVKMTYRKFGKRV